MFRFPLSVSPLLVRLKYVIALFDHVSISMSISLSFLISLMVCLVGYGTIELDCCSGIIQEDPY